MVIDQAHTHTYNYRVVFSGEPQSANCHMLEALGGYQLLVVALLRPFT